MNSVFHPAGKNPFQLPPLPQSHYNPSPSKEILDKSVTLTPQKPKHRHEYSLPPEVYTPDQYSIHEDEAASSKPPLPSRIESDDIVQNLQRYLDDVESWNSEQFCEQWPSKDSVTEDPPQQTPIVTSTMSGKPLSSTTRSFKPKPQSSVTKNTKPYWIKTSFASEKNVLLSADSERSSIIQERLDRFRYGEPKPPEERKKKTKLPTPSSTQSAQLLSSHAESKSSVLSSRKASTPRLDDSQGKLNASTLSKFSRITSSSHRIPSPKPSNVDPKSTASPRIEDSPDPPETSLSTLNTKLEKLLKESTSVISTPEPQASVSASVDKSSSFEMRVSSSNDTTKSSELEISQLRPRNHMHQIENEIPRTMLWQKEKTGFPTSPAKVQKENDILYQWRLRRKLEVARENVEKKTGPSFQQPHPSYAPPIEVQAEKPLISSPLVHHPYTPVTHQPLPTQAHEPHPTQAIFQQHMPNPILQGAPPNFVTHPPVFHPQPLQNFTRPPTQGPGCNCQVTYQDRCSYPSPKKDAGTSPIPFQSPPLSPKEKLTVSSETQTGQSLILLNNEPPDGSQSKSDQEPVKRSASVGSFPHTSTPASSVSFHRVKIVQAEQENSPQTSKESPQARNLSPMSGKTEATTLWSSTDHNKKSDDGRSPLSSIKTSDPRFASDSETCSPTANVVKEVIGSRLFNTSQTPSSSSAISRLKNGKKGREENTERPTMVDDLNGSYTFSERSSDMSKKEKISDSGSDRSSTKLSRRENASGSASETLSEKSPPDEDEPDASSVKLSKRKNESTKSYDTGNLETIPRKVLPRSETPSQSEDDELSSNQSQVTVSDTSTVDKGGEERGKPEFDAGGLFDNLLKDLEDKPQDHVDTSVVEALKGQKDDIVQEFRLLEELINNEPPTDDEPWERN